jgi:prephenate dehydratase
MAFSVRSVAYYYVTVPNEAGTGARALSTFQEAGVNLLAVHAFPVGRLPVARRTQIDLVPEDGAALRRAARKAKLRLSPRKKALLVEGDDRIGVVAQVLDRLGRRGINVTAITAVAAGKKRFGAIFWVKARDVARALRAARGR